MYPLNIFCLLCVLCIVTFSFRMASSAACATDKFECRNISQCIDISKLCDDTPDCTDFTDEDNCTQTETCPEGGHRCSNGVCNDPGDPCPSILSSFESLSEMSTPSPVLSPSLSGISQISYMVTSYANSIEDTSSRTLQQTPNVDLSISTSDYDISSSPSLNTYLSALVPTSWTSMMSSDAGGISSPSFPSTATGVSSTSVPSTDTGVSSAYYLSTDTGVSSPSFPSTDTGVSSTLFPSTDTNTNPISPISELLTPSTPFLKIDTYSSSADVEGISTKIPLSSDTLRTTSVYSSAEVSDNELSSTGSSPVQALTSIEISASSVALNSVLETFITIPGSVSSVLTSEITSSMGTTTPTTTTGINIVNEQSMLSDVIVSLALAGVLLVLTVVGSAFVIKYAKNKLNQQNTDDFKDELCSSEKYELNSIDFSFKRQWHFPDPDDPF